MPSKKKKYNARFPAGRIKKIMQTDEEVGKVAQAVPIIISRTLELFVESLLTKTMLITESRNARTLTPSHLKQCIQSESRFDFLKDLVRGIPDASIQEDNENNAEYANTSQQQDTFTPANHAATAVMQSTASNYQATIVRTPVIRYQPKVEIPILTSVAPVGSTLVDDEPKIKIEIARPELNISPSRTIDDQPPPLVPISFNTQTSSVSDNLYIDEDYDN